MSALALLHYPALIVAPSCRSAHYRVVRHVGIGLPAPSCPSTRQHWAPVSLDTAALGCLRRRVFRHVSDGFPVPSCLAARRRRVPCAFVSCDTSTTGTLCLRVLRHVGDGFPVPPRWPRFVVVSLPLALNLRMTGPHPSGEGRGTACA